MDSETEKRLRRLEAEVRELYMRLAQRDKQFEDIRRAYIGLRPEDRRKQ